MTEQQDNLGFGSRGGLSAGDGQFAPAERELELNYDDFLTEPDVGEQPLGVGQPVVVAEQVFANPVAETYPAAPPIAAEAPIAPVAAETGPWVSEPQYGQYARGGAPGYPTAPGYGIAPMPPAAPMYQKPGIIPLRPLRLGEIFDGAFAAVRANPAVMLGLPALVIAIATVLGVALGALFGNLLTPFANTISADPEFMSAQQELYNLGINFNLTELARLTGTGLGMTLTTALASPIVYGLLTYAISQAAIGKRPSVSDVWGRVAPRIGALIGWTILSTLIISAAFALLAVVIGLLAGLTAGSAAVLFVIPLMLLIPFVALWLAVKLVFVPAVIVLENASIGQAIRRSWNLTRGSFWRILGIYLLATILVGIIGQLITWPVGFLLGLVGGGSAWLTVSTVITSIISTLISSIFMAGVIALLYVDVRMRREGLADSLLAAAQAPAAVAY